MKKHILISTLVFGLASTSLAAGRSTYTSIHQNYVSIRAAGMGGAFAAVANDEGAIFYNPAALARFTAGKMQGSFIDGGLTSSFMTFFTDLTNALNSGNPLTIANFLSSQTGKAYFGRAKMLEAYWIRPNWGIAFIPFDFSVDILMNDTLNDNSSVPAPNSPGVNLRYITDSNLAFSYATTIKNESFGLLSIGATGKLVFRQMLNRLHLVTDANVNITDTDKSDGLATDIDLGILFTPYLPEGDGWNWLRATRPTFAVVGRNLIDSGFGNKMILKNSVYQADKLNRVYDFGMRFEIPKFWIFGGRFAIDQRNIGHPNYIAAKALHAGFEFDWTMTNWWKGQWRAGYGGGYPSFGFSALLSFFRLDLAMYSEEVGTTTSALKQNQIFQFKMSGEF